MGPRAGLEQELRAAIRSGRLAAGRELPSTRSLAADLGLARSTVVSAYEQLAIEGYLTARQGRSTTVASITTLSPAGPDHNPMGEQYQYDFRPGEPALGSFPRRQWQQSMRHVVMQAPDDAFGYGDPRGRVELRRALGDYVARARMVHADTSMLRIYAGFSSSLGFIGETLVRRGARRIAVEQPMLPFHQQILALVGVETVNVPVDPEGIRVDELARHDVQAVLVTPGNQQPLGVTMTSTRRSELVAWAQESDAWIIEDDYDGEFRYDRRPIGALQGLDPDHVLYAGTASKSLGPGLHLSWLVVPPGLRRDLATVTHLRAGVSTLNQLAFADFLERGAYDRHIRGQRRVYGSRREELIAIINRVPWAPITSDQAGMHVVANLVQAPVSESTLIERADQAGIGLLGLRTHFAHTEEGLVINVSRPADHQFRGALVALERLFAEFD